MSSKALNIIGTCETVIAVFFICDSYNSYNSKALDKMIYKRSCNEVPEAMQNSGSGNPRIPKGSFARYRAPPSGPRVVMKSSSSIGPPKVSEVGDETGKWTVISITPFAGFSRTTRLAPLNATHRNPSASFK